jgi:DNA-binding protein YbaB
MDAEPEVIRQDIEQTRSSLTEKLETLEDQVLGTVRSATESVEETIENVTETVQETVETVQRTFDVEYQMQQRPWLLIGGSVAAGVAVGVLANSLRARSGRGENRSSYVPSYGRSTGNGGSAFRSPQPEYTAPPRQEGPSFIQSLLGRFDKEIGMVKEMAIGYAAGVLRDVVKEALPAVKERVQEVMDSATKKMGGKPVDGPVFQEQPRHDPQTADKGRL